MKFFPDPTTVSLKVIEVIDPVPFAAELFQQAFRTQVPDFPKHFILLARNPSGVMLILGYVHFTQMDRIFLGGGMCVNTQAMRRLPKTTRIELAQAGGVAHHMLSAAVGLLTDCDAVFGYVGHPGAYKIDMAVGFQPTQHPHLIVYWKNKQLDTTEQQALIEQANQVGPF